MVRKNKQKLLTYKHPGTNPTHSIQKPHYDTTDYWLPPQRWKNAIQDCEADWEANLDTDHYPVIIKIRLRLKSKIKNKLETRTQFEKATTEQFQKYNIAKTKDLGGQREMWDVTGWSLPLILTY